MAAISPVPGRVCGACTACCTVMDIRDPDLVKPAGKPCDHLWGGGDKHWNGGCSGCAITKNWPTICRDYFCGWRLMPQLGDEWRPDLSGVLLTSPGGEVPHEMVAMGAIKIVLIERRACSWVPLVEFVHSRVQQKIPVYVTVAGKEGQQTYTGFLNYELEHRDLSYTIVTLQTAYDEISGMMAGNA